MRIFTQGKYVWQVISLVLVSAGAASYLQPMEPTGGLPAAAVANLPSPKPPAIQEIHAVYMADFADPEILMGGSHNVFIGKVLEQTGNQERGIGPETQFSVQVISNIKGNLQGTVSVNQQGGYKDGVLYVVHGGPQQGDILGPAGEADGYLLEPGSTYLLATRYNPEKNWYMLNSFSTARKTLSENSALGTGQLQALAAGDARVQELQAAYPQEVLLVADIGHSNTLNSYQSLSEQQKAALPYYTAPPPPPPAPAPTSTPAVVAPPPPPAAPASTSTPSSTTP